MKFLFNKSFFISFILTALLSGCVNELIPEKNGYQPQVVVWAILNLDKEITAITSGNRGLEDKDIVNIASIDMLLYEDGILVETLLAQTISNDTQSHHFSIKALKDRKYTLKISNTSTEISGTVTMISPLSKPDTIELSKGDNAQLKYTLADEEKYVDAYQFDVEIYHLGVLTDTADNSVLNNNYLLIKKYDTYDEPSLIYTLRGLSSPVTSTYTFPVNDYLFNGKKKTFLFALQNPVSDVLLVPRQNSVDLPVSDKLDCKKRFVVVRCLKISPDYYNFYVSENKNNAIFGTPYFNPTNLYSNITGGLGLMAAMTERADTVWIKK